MNPQQLKDAIVEVLKEKKVDDLTVIDVAAKTEIADYMIIMTGRNNTHVRTLCDFLEEITREKEAAEKLLEEKMEKKGVYAQRKEGVREGRWVVVDYASVIVHIFNKEMRGYFALEQLWEDGDNITKIEE